HPRGATPVSGGRLVKANRPGGGAGRGLGGGARGGRGVRPSWPAEGGGEAGAGRELGDVARRARALRRSWRAEAVVVTLGEEGALLVTGGGAPLVAPAPRLSVLDPCGAGDRFSSTAAGLLADGATAEEAVTVAV